MQDWNTINRTRVGLSEGFPTLLISPLLSQNGCSGVPSEVWIHVTKFGISYLISVFPVTTSAYTYASCASQAAKTASTFLWDHPPAPKVRISNDSEVGWVGWFGESPVCLPGIQLDGNGNQISRQVRDLEPNVKCNFMESSFCFTFGWKIPLVPCTSWHVDHQLNQHQFPRS